jgi:hypothetical protein
MTLLPKLAQKRAAESGITASRHGAASNKSPVKDRCDWREAWKFSLQVSTTESRPARDDRMVVGRNSRRS